MTSRWIRCTAALLLALAGFVATPVGPVAAQTGTSLTAADRDLVVRVRLAGLWEMPAGQMAATKGSSPRVREVGALIKAQHEALDGLVVTAARRLGVTLPDEPTPEQSYWLREMRAASGPAFDRAFVQRLREAHGRIFPAIAAVRAGTRNPVVRALADDANGFVKTHLDLLDSTGSVDYGSLPPLAVPAPHEHRFVLLGDPRYPDDGGRTEQLRQVLVGLTGGLAALLAFVLTIRVFVPSAGTRVVRPAEPVAGPHRRRRDASSTP